MLIPLSVLWPVTMIVAGGSSFTMFFIRESISPMTLLSTKCSDAPKSKVMVHFSGPGVAEPARNQKPMPDRDDSMALYGVGVSCEVNEATGVGSMAAGEGVPLGVTAVLARPVL